MANSCIRLVAVLLPAVFLWACDPEDLDVDNFPLLTVYGLVTEAQGGAVVGALVRINYHAAVDCSGGALGSGHAYTNSAGEYQALVGGPFGPRESCLEAIVTSDELGEVIETRTPFLLQREGDDYAPYRFDISY